MTAKGQDLFYMFLSSEDCKGIYPQNTPQDFIVQLPERLRLQGSWSVALAEVTYPSDFKGVTPPWLHLEVDLCETSIVGDQKMSILRRLPSTAQHLTFNPLFYIPMRHQEFDHVHVYIKEPSGATASFVSGLSCCTLQFVRL